jgi:hypothetical protein
VYVGDAGRVYVTLPAPANGPEVGQSYELPADPGDGRWKRDHKDPEPPATPEPASSGETSKE